jgi:hypothetical protein
VHHIQQAAKAPNDSWRLETSLSLRQPLHMDIDLTGFSASQQQALFDLLILAMYADGHLTTIEDEHSL